MDTICEILIIAFTLFITVIPFFGDLWKRVDNQLKIYRRGYFFLGSSIFLLICGVYLIIVNNIDQSVRDSKMDKTFNNTVTIIGNINQSIESLENTLLKLDSLNIKLDSVESKTNSSIERRNELLFDFNQLNYQLEKVNLNENNKIKENIPIINITPSPKWVKRDEYYYIEVRFQNNGVRSASDFKVTALFLKSSKSNKITETKFITDEFKVVNDLPPITKVQRDLVFDLAGYPMDTKIDTVPMGYICIFYTYNDFVTGENFTKLEHYRWDSNDSFGLYWMFTNKSETEYINNYLKENNIDIKTAHNIQ